MPFGDHDPTATATVAAVLSQVHRRTARLAQAQGVPALATTEADEGDLRGILRRVTRKVAVRTGRVLRQGELAVGADGALGPLPSWAEFARVSAWYREADGADLLTLDVRHGVPTRVAGPAPRVLFVDPSGGLTLAPAATSGAVVVRCAVRKGLAEAAAVVDDAFEDAFPDDLEGAVVAGVVAGWLRQLGARDLADEAKAEMADDLHVFGRDGTQTGFARPSKTRHARTPARRR